MTILNRLTVVASISALALAAAACTPAENEADTAAEGRDTTTIVEREVPGDPVIVEREVPVPTPPVVVEDRRDGDSTTIRANGDGLEVETTNR
jgi:hypothetical protein